MKLSKKLNKIIFTIIILCSFSSNGSKNEYIVGVEDYTRYPYQYVEKGEYKGNFRNILDEFAKQEGIKFKYKPLKINNIYEELYSQKIDFKFPDNPVWRSPQKNKYVIYYSDIITSYIDGIFVNKKNLGKKLEDIKIIGAVDDILLWALAKKKKENKITVVKAASCGELINRLRNEEINGIYCNYDVMMYLLKNSHNQDVIRMDTDLPFIDNYFHISTINNPDIIQKFNIWISKNRSYIEKNTHNDN